MKKIKWSKQLRRFKRLIDRRYIRFWIVGIVVLVVLLYSFLHQVKVKKLTIKPVYTVARDPTLYPLQVGGEGLYMRAFSDDLLNAIADIEDLQINIISLESNQLLFGLEQGSYDGIFSTLSPTPMNKKLYLFSDPYYLLGPVLIVPESSNVTSLKQMSGKVVGVLSGSSSIFVLQQNSQIQVTTYDNLISAFNDLVANNIDGLLVGAWNAYTYVQGYYPNKLKIVTPPLTDYGLRLVTKNLSIENPLIERFNKGLTALKEKGTYQFLLNKWNLYNTERELQN